MNKRKYLVVYVVEERFYDENNKIYVSSNQYENKIIESEINEINELLYDEINLYHTKGVIVNIIPLMN